MSQQLSPANEQALKQLVRCINLSQGQFSLILACCESHRLRQQINRQLQAKLSISIELLTLDPVIKTIFTGVQQLLRQRQPGVLVISGLDGVVDLEGILSATNLVREDFRHYFHCPMILWVNGEVLRQLRRVAPDLRSWAASPIYFEENRSPLNLFDLEIATPLQSKLIRAHNELDNYPVNVALIEPESLEIMPLVARAIKQQQSVILNLTKLDLDTAQRAIDFLAGCTYAIEGHKQQLVQGIFLFTPSYIKVRLTS